MDIKMPKINPDWQVAENARLIVEAKYEKARVAAEQNIKIKKEAFELTATAYQAANDAWNKEVQSLNAEIEAANQLVRGRLQYLPEEVTE